MEATGTLTTKPRSCVVTNAELGAMGFPVRVTDKSMGQVMVVTEGLPRNVAVFEAWAAGLVTMASSTEAEVEARLAGFEAKVARERACVAEVLAELRSAGMAR